MKVAVKGAKTIAEYAIRRWLLEQGFVIEHFSLSLDGNIGVLTDRNNDALTLVYEPDIRSVRVKED